MLVKEKIITVLDVILDEWEIGDKKNPVRIPIYKFRKLGHDDIEKIVRTFQGKEWLSHTRFFVVNKLESGLTVEATIEFQLLKLDELTKHRDALRIDVGREIGAMRETYQEFRFVDGVLFRDFENAVEKFSEKDLQYALLQKAFVTPLQKWIDAIDIDCEASRGKGARSLYDAAIAINKKVRGTFTLKDDFFEADKSGNRCRRMAR